MKIFSPYFFETINSKRGADRSKYRLTIHKKRHLAANYSKADAQMSSAKNVFLEMSQFTGKHMCQSLFFNKVAGLQLY